MKYENKEWDIGQFMTTCAKLVLSIFESVDETNICLGQFEICEGQEPDMKYLYANDTICLLIDHNLAVISQYFSNRLVCLVQRHFLSSNFHSPNLK